MIQHHVSSLAAILSVSVACHAGAWINPVQDIDVDATFDDDETWAAWRITGGSRVTVNNATVSIDKEFPLFEIDGPLIYTFAINGGTVTHLDRRSVIECAMGVDNVLNVVATSGAFLATDHNARLVDTGDGNDILTLNLTGTGMRGVLDGGSGEDTLILDGTGRIATGDHGTDAVRLRDDSKDDTLDSTFEHLRKQGAGSWTVVGGDGHSSGTLRISTLQASGSGELYVQNDVQITGDCSVSGFDPATSSASRFVVMGSLDVGGDVAVSDGAQLLVENGGAGVLSLAPTSTLTVASTTWDPGDQFPPSAMPAGVTLLIVGPNPETDGPAHDRLNAAGATLNVTGGALLANADIDNSNGTLNVTDAGLVAVYGSLTGGTVNINTDGIVAVYDPTGGSNGALTVQDLNVGNASSTGQLHVFGGLTATGDVTARGDGTLISIAGAYNNDHLGSTTTITEGAQLDVVGTLQAYNLTVTGGGEVNVAGTVQLNPQGMTTITDGELNVLTGGSLVGDAEIQGGSARINGTNTGDVTVTGGTLDGIGTIEGDLDLAGGTFAPGNSVGTLTIDDGNYTLRSGATLQIEIDSDTSPATHDQIIVRDTDQSGDDGKATLNGGTIEVVKLGSGAIRNGQQFPIIQTTGGVTVLTDPTITDNSAVLSFAGDLSADQLDYLLIASRIATFASQARTANGSSLGAALDGMESGSLTAEQDALIAELQSLDAASLNRAMRQLDANPYMLGMQSGITGAQALNGQVAGRTSAVRSGSPAMALLEMRRPQQSVARFASAGVEPALLAAALGGSAAAVTPNEPAWQAWARGFGVLDRQDTTDQRLGYNANTGGAMAGFDRRVGEDALLGLLVSYSYTDVSYDLGRGEADAHSLRVGPYGSMQWDQLFVDASLTFGYTMHDSDRQVRVGALQYSPEAEYDAWDLAAYAGVGYAIELGRWTVTPGAALLYTYYDQEAFDETGGGPVNQAVAAYDSDSLRSRLTVGVSRVFEGDALDLVLEGNVGWSHEYLDPEPVLARFVGQTSSFTFDPGSHGEDAVIFGAGATLLMDKGRSAFLRYDGEAHGDGHTHAVTAGMTFAF